ncbi:MAG: hypothetical protein VCA55_01590 [Verrucomicrobiales bacterium]|jgi:hypothetical protein
MMASNSSWIDPDELARLGSELVGNRPEGSPVYEEEEGLLVDLFGDPIELGTDNRVEFPMAGAEIGRVGEQLAAIKERASRSGLLRSEDSGAASRSVSETKLLPGSGVTLVERLESFVAWAAGKNDLTGLFITDLGGNELVESGADSSLVASGIALAEGWQRALGELEATATNGVSTAASVRDWEGAVLTVFSCRSAYGRHVLGVLSPGALSSILSGGLRSGFSRVMGVGE